ncbi:hypothetical protein LP123_12425 [Moraxella bovis]|uniref:Uncharacterized protein n=1 Tax=Moraxella bovis TaxID=476 RepID=A0AAQ2Q268_MORBO|nr:hypothetical protein [Moraxella bovis]UYZ68119.1 hypothetical protein LP122_10180 [Moraxella bovis]UYZ70500.1 hypothetical protein LP089_10330 [Moraxella bovis]UYZ73580.1 hypothetical protein LP105_02345 [Moraxella bovis]UYZ76108.1 hypothetical protein LP093_01880 [Moraxella bovis]UYZ77939.1 hypothetical protein LP115_11915 [Moraxella bovis]
MIDEKIKDKKGKVAQGTQATPKSKAKTPIFIKLKPKIMPYKVQFLKIGKL